MEYTREFTPLNVGRGNVPRETYNANLITLPPQKEFPEVDHQKYCQ